MLFKLYKAIAWLSLISLLVIISGCGQTGNLYLPNNSNSNAISNTKEVN